MSKYICAWSGGKDSTASIILAHIHNEPLDTIVFSEVMYDRKKNISGENPYHIDFIYNIAKPLFESWGYEVLILRADTDYLEYFNKTIKNPRRHMEHKDMKRGFPISRQCGIKRDCKEKPMNKYLRSLENDYIQYVGIAIDEPTRLKSMHKDASKISLLEKYEYTEYMATTLCKIYGLLSPTYNLSNRGGCWFCPNAKLKEHEDIKNIYPKAWKQFVKLESAKNIAGSKWNIFSKTSLKQRDEYLKYGYYQASLFN